MTRTNIVYALSDEVCFTLKIGGAKIYILGNFFHIRFVKTACGDCRSSDSDTACYKRLFGVVGDGILVGGDVHLVQTALQLLAGHAGLSQVDEHKVVVRAAGHQIKTALHDGLGQHSGVFHDLLLIGLELGLEGLAQGHRLGGDDVLQGAALGAGEDGGVDALDDILVVRQNQAAAGAAQRLVGRGGDHVGVGHGALVLAACDKTRNVRHIDHQHRAVAVGDLGQLLKVDGAGIGRCTGDQQLGRTFATCLASAA